MKLYVKKIWSLNPTKFKYISLETALFNYEHYLTFFDKGWKQKEAPKRFEEWLKSEI